MPVFGLSGRAEEECRQDKIGNVRAQTGEWNYECRVAIIRL